MDPLSRLSLQTDISKLLDAAQKDFEITDILRRADRAVTARKWKDALDLYTDAKARFVPDVQVLQLLTSSGVCKSPAAARRDVEAGHVMVDGVRLRHVTAMVSKDVDVTYKGAPVRAGRR